ncbi:response regulator [Motiliproteus sp. MSK22-1]|uniref:response regulator n=1 Tax=Motiliproteus sp. MSK22-1 TaxID=1897630 RepID=UPI000976852E|nr:response regulator [Motiliproteus sp. MSK22-1]OMH25897.1 hypothetical protein BGP75_25640 [Motiliproteus sp. MSK22-1]
MNRVMIVDDEPGVLNSLKRALRGESWVLMTYSDPEEALNVAAKEVISLVISDYRMPQMDGVTFLKEFKAIQPESFRMVLSGQADMAAVLSAINEAEIYRFVTKPWNNDDLKISIDTALKHRDILMENQRLADLVRKQQIQLDYQKTELDRLETECPGITQVNWDSDGCIILNDKD